MPVLVFVHGGGFTTGSATSVLYGGERLARRGAVVVTFNYRLGALGFLAHPALAEHGDASPRANWGLRDQVAALRWVRDHAEAFGGDPDNVTLFGESAGAMSIGALVAAPSAAGLFRRVVIQSGPPYAHTWARAVEAATEFGKELGLDELDRPLLESVPATDLAAATQALQNRRPAPGELPLPFLPAIDGNFIPVHPFDAVESGRAPEVEMIVGTNRDELSLFVASGAALPVIDEARVLRWVRRAVSASPGRPGAEELIDACRSARSRRGEPDSARDLLVAIGTDAIFRWPSLRLASAHARRVPSTFVYLFTWESPALDGLLGSTHALELPFVFGTIDRPVLDSLVGFGPEASALSERMQRAWLAFASSGDPGNEVSGDWPRWDPLRRPTMVFSSTSGPVDGPRDDELECWRMAEASDTGLAHGASVGQALRGDVAQ